MRARGSRRECMTVHLFPGLAGDKANRGQCRSRRRVAESATIPTLDCLANLGKLGAFRYSSESLAPSATVRKAWRFPLQVGKLGAFRYLAAGRSPARLTACKAVLRAQAMDNSRVGFHPDSSAGLPCRSN